jgi:hypothetical protein
VKNYDTVRDVKTSGGSKAELFKDGHAGVLTINLEAKPENETTVRASYKTPVHPGIPLEGIIIIMPTIILYSV